MKLDMQGGGGVGGGGGRAYNGQGVHSREPSLVFTTTSVWAAFHSLLRRLKKTYVLFIQKPFLVGC